MEWNNNGQLTSLFRLFGLFVFIGLVSACENGIIGSGEKPAPPKHGIAQKGPFAINSNITITVRPAPNYLPTSTEQVQTQDDIGSFEYEFKPDTLYDISVTGKHYNEIDGQISSDEITLMSSYYQDDSSQSFVSVNILTHIVHSRINYLVTASGMHPRDATAQASRELLDDLKSIIFAEHLAEFNFSSMSVYNLGNTNTKENAVLLFISAAFYQQSLMFDNSRPLNEMLTALADDMEKDGTIDGKTDPASTPVNSGNNGSLYISSLDFAARLLNPDLISNNLSQHSLDKLGFALPVPDISFLLDNDADGVSNDIDTDDDGDGIPDLEDANPTRFEIIPLPQTYSVRQAGSVDIALQFNRPEDSEGNTLYLAYDALPAHGTLSGDMSNLVYTPDPDYSGLDSFTYKLNCFPCAAIYSGIYTSDVVTVNIAVSAQ